MKRKYLPPKISLVQFEIDDCLTISSAITKPATAADVKEFWETDSDVTIPTFSWE